ncbi:calpain-1 catalytic subunit-like [Pseudochaenichthys georgianus]|uniref:calpain-1 catalytic subunit-like n=1 Tax=Pseudochaenichthys georgianus TaxID=52239 RepID=UPI00146DD8A0|nr:calpain-1 catalytic subunit-like [Pseudochaenichthys georgianus]
MTFGWPSESFKDLCGGVNIKFSISDEKKVWTILSNASSCNAMICCTSYTDKERKWAEPEDGTIQSNHVYTVTAVIEVMKTIESSKVKLVRVINPYGKFEWEGKWSDESDMWKKVSEKDRENCKVDIDGEFWMELEDFCRNLKDLYICCENPNFIDGDVNCQWQSLTHHGKCTNGKSAGDVLSNPSFGTNPQYRQKVNIIDASESKDIHIILSLMKNHGQVNRKEKKGTRIGIHVFKIPPGTAQGDLSTEDIKKLTQLNGSNRDTHWGELVETHSMEPGEYLIVPSIKVPDQSADFVLTIFSKTNAKIN